MKKRIITILLLGGTSLSFAQMKRNECLTQLNTLVKEIKLDIKTSDLDIEKADDNYNHKGKISFQEITEKTIVYQIEDLELKTKIKIEYSNINWDHLKAAKIGSSKYSAIAHGEDLGEMLLTFDSNKSAIWYKEYKNNTLILTETNWNIADLFFDQNNLEEIEILINRLIEIATNPISLSAQQNDTKKEPTLQETRDKIFEDLRSVNAFEKIYNSSLSGGFPFNFDLFITPELQKCIDMIENKEYKKAITALNLFIKNNPDNMESYFFRGKAKYNIENYKDAINDFNTHIKSKSFSINKSKAHLYRGLSKIKLKETDAGCLDLYKAKELLDDEADKQISEYCK